MENHLATIYVTGTPAIQNTYDGDGARAARSVYGTATHYVGDWYENNPATNTPTVYYPFNGQPIAMKQGTTLYYLHRDQVGSVVSVSNSSGGEVGSARYWPFGGLRSTTGTLPTDRLFTGQTRDYADDRLYFFKARYYDATIGRFHAADTVVPDPKDPQALNRYAYVLNNPLKLVDPGGHDPSSPMDPRWVSQFIQAHGYNPSDRDWRDYQFSLLHSGSGPNGSWTAQDWRTFSDVRTTLGDFLREVGHPEDDPGIYDLLGPGVINIGNIGAEIQGQWEQGPDGTRILRGDPPPNTRAITLGGTIIIDRNLQLSPQQRRALLAHEYTHVLQYRAIGPDFGREYRNEGFNNWTTNRFEVQAVHIESI